MSMEINGKYSQYPTDYSKRLEEEQEKVKETEKEQNGEKKNEGIPISKDEYISSEKSGSKLSGLYRLGQDENGNPKVLYDDPKKATAPQKDEPAKKAEECTTNTDNVDREIEKLKEDKKQLEHQIQAAAGDEEKIKELEKKLTQIEGELSQKDNDTYRRKNAASS